MGFGEKGHLLVLGARVGIGNLAVKNEMSTLKWKLSCLFWLVTAAAQRVPLQNIAKRFGNVWRVKRLVPRNSVAQRQKVTDHVEIATVCDVRMPFGTAQPCCHSLGSHALSRGAPASPGAFSLPLSTLLSTVVLFYSKRKREKTNRIKWIKGKKTLCQNVQISDFSADALENATESAFVLTFRD